MGVTKLEKPTRCEILLICDWCGAARSKMTIWQHSSGRILTLCFHGCQHFPEPFKATGMSTDWHRIDNWVTIRRQPNLQRNLADWRVRLKGGKTHTLKDG